MFKLNIFFIPVLIFFSPFLRSQNFEAEVYYSRGNQEKDFKLKKIFFDLSHKEYREDLDGFNADIQIRLAERYRYIKDWSTFKELALKLIAEDETPHTVNQAIGYKFLGDYYMFNNDNVSALYNFMKCEKTLDYTNNSRVRMSLWLSFCELFYYIGDIHSIEKYAVKILKSNEKEESDRFSALCWLGTSAEKAKDTDKAREYYFRALELSMAENYSIKSHTAYALYSIALAEYEDKRFASSLKYCEAALKSMPSLPHYDLLYLIQDHLLYMKFKLNYKQIDYPLLFDLNQKTRFEKNIEIGSNYNRFYRAESIVTHQRDSALMGIKSAIQISQRFKSIHDEVYFRKGYLKYTETFDSINFARFQLLTAEIVKLDRRARNKFSRIAFEAHEIAEETKKTNRHKYIIAGSGTSSCLLLLIVLSIKNQRHRRRRAKLLRRQHELEVDLFNTSLQTQSDLNRERINEKHRIARELHDGVMNNLASTRLNLYQLDDHQITYKDRLFFAGKIEEIENELTSLSDRIASGGLSEGNPRTRIENWIQQYRGFSQSDVVLTVDDAIDFSRLSYLAKNNIFRIIQEALLNTHKYAAATKVEISMRLSENVMSMTIQDNGIGFTPGNHGMGLSSMAERASEAGGSFAVKSQPKKGTIIDVKIPLEKI